MQTNELVEAIRDLGTEVLEARLAGQEVNKIHYTTSFAALMTTFHCLNRSSIEQSNDLKAKTQQVRLEMDSAHLRLQNLQYEQNHLEREIRKCEEFKSIYQNIELPEEELPEKEDRHEWMLRRLQHELAERKRLDDEKKALGQVKNNIIKENQVKKQQLEVLESQLTGFVKSALDIQEKMHKGQNLPVVS